jgi:hypothetical protein
VTNTAKHAGAAFAVGTASTLGLLLVLAATAATAGGAVRQDRGGQLRAVAHRSSSCPTSFSPRTYIGRPRGANYVSPEYASWPYCWYASWGGPVADPGAWVQVWSTSTYFAGCESETDAHRYGVARRSSPGVWVVNAFPSFARRGTIRIRSRTHADIYNRSGHLLVRTFGPAGVPAGLAWLTLRNCHL